MLSSVVPFSLPTPLPGLRPEPDTVLFATNTPLKNKRKHCTETGSYLRLPAIQRPSAPSRSRLVPMSTTKTKPASNPSYGHTAQGQLPRCSGMTRRTGDTEFVLLLGLQHQAWGRGRLRINSKGQPHSCSSCPHKAGLAAPNGARLSAGPQDRPRGVMRKGPRGAFCRSRSGNSCEAEITLFLQNGSGRWPQEQGSSEPCGT